MISESNTRAANFDQHYVSGRLTLSRTREAFAGVYKPVVKLIAYRPQKDRVPGAWKGKVVMSDDFNEEDPEINAMFYEDIN